MIFKDVGYNLKIIEFERLAYTSKIIGASNKLYDGKELIISLTTYGKRIHDVHPDIESLFAQTTKANRILLRLSKDEFCMNSK